LLEVSGGNYESMALFGLEDHARASTRSREAYFLDYARRVRSVTDVPLMVTGGFPSAAGPGQAPGSGALDLIGMARPLAADPDFPRKLLEAQVDRSPIAPIRLGSRKLDGLAEAGFYARQLERMGDGLLPELRLRKLWSGLRYATLDMLQAVRWRRERRRLRS